MADLNISHEVPLSAAPEQRIDTELQETVPVNEDENQQPLTEENVLVPQSHTDESCTPGPTSNTHSLTSGEGTAIDAPETEVGELQQQEPMEKPVVLRSWLFELLALLIGFLSLAGIITILGVYNGQPQLELARDVNINTIIAILSTTLRAVMAFIATEGKMTKSDSIIGDLSAEIFKLSGNRNGNG
ncbi:hypothetical protein CGCSCA4_v010183 [Colletotrichum siamense]|uniref:Uncharacterized protein n=1 Tax=Colletotrichum siamense TaxID=690259 RepID=A0A9P5K1V0_COLSI|nr:hypothetical protein CGCSCA4_v010183 [Colletotrichum siamense]KAF4855323.1 hypothetical protein CGCSCA2_v009124 [Colletotrichum siamense]